MDVAALHLADDLPGVPPAGRADRRSLGARLRPLDGGPTCWLRVHSSGAAFPVAALARARRPSTEPTPARFEMAAYIVRRLWQMIPTLLGVVLLVFLLFKFFGGDPAEILGGLNATQQQVRADPRPARPEQPLVRAARDLPEGHRHVRLGPQLGHQRGGRPHLRDPPAGDADGDAADPRSSTPCSRCRSRCGSRTGAARSATARSWSSATVALSISFLVYIIVGQYVFGFQLGWFPVQGWSDSTVDQPRALRAAAGACWR